MNAQTIVSAKGQVVIPKQVRERLHLAPGDRLEVVERHDGVLLRKPSERSDESFDAITARIRGRVRHVGPPLEIEDMDAAIGTMWAGGGPSWDT
jgi:AbrB family looped-hinge helix DNA binding protein